MAEASKRSVYSVLNKERLEDLGRNPGIPVLGNATKGVQVAALANSPIDLPSTPERLRRDELRSGCRAHGLDATGCGLRDLVARLAGPGLASGARLNKDGDRAKLAAYRRSNIPVPPFETAQESFEDDSIDRLFALNVERAEKKSLQGTGVLPPSTAKKSGSKKAENVSDRQLDLSLGKKRGA